MARTVELMRPPNDSKLFDLEGEVAPCHVVGAGHGRAPKQPSGLRRYKVPTGRSQNDVVQLGFRPLLWTTSAAIVRWPAVLWPLVPQQIARACKQLDDGIN